MPIKSIILSFLKAFQKASRSSKEMVSIVKVEVTAIKHSLDECLRKSEGEHAKAGQGLTSWQTNINYSGFLPSLFSPAPRVCTGDAALVCQPEKKLAPYE